MLRFAGNQSHFKPKLMQYSFDLRKITGTSIAMTLMFVALSFSGCLEDTVNIGETDRQLFRIDTENRSSDWTEEFGYSEEGTLEFVENGRSFGRRMLVTYDLGRVAEVRTIRISDSLLVFRDEYLYDDEGKVVTVLNYSINSGEDLPLSRVDSFIYDSSSKLMEKTTSLILGREVNPISISRYFWEGDNVVHEEYYNGEGVLHYEYFYEYDNGLNYKKGLGIYLSNPIDWSENNVVEMDWTDHLGNLDIICRPCTSTYTYNIHGLPVTIRSNTGRNSRLTYR